MKVPKDLGDTSACRGNRAELCLNPSCPYNYYRYCMLYLKEASLVFILAFSSVSTPTKACIYLTAGHMSSMVNVFHLGDSFFPFSVYRELDILLHVKCFYSGTHNWILSPLTEYLKYI